VLRQLVAPQQVQRQLGERLVQAQQLAQVQQPGEQLEALPVRGQQQVAQLEQQLGRQRELRQPELEPRLHLNLIR
jgi:hypothetical protein